MQATEVTRGQPITSPPRAAPRPQPHRSGCGQQTPLCAMYVHSSCAVRCLPHDPTASWTPGRICKLSIPLGGSLSIEVQATRRRQTLDGARWPVSMCLHTNSTTLCVPRDHTAAWIQCKTCRLSVSPGGSPPQRGHNLSVLCVSRLGVHSCARTVIPVRWAGWLDYPFYPGVSYDESTTGHLREQKCMSIVLSHPDQSHKLNHHRAFSSRDETASKLRKG